MRVITAVDNDLYNIPQESFCVFLAGGITNCREWQKEVISALLKEKSDDRDIVLLNPRRDNFPMDDPNASEEQIQWEFDALERADLFTMFFDDSTSDQPICFYELGRNIERMQEKFPASWESRIIVSCDENFKRKQDVIIQTRLATDGLVDVWCADKDVILKEHISAISMAITEVDWS